VDHPHAGGLQRPRRTARGSFHGISINVALDLAHFEAIMPCGVAVPRYGVTSLADLGHPATMADLDLALRQAFGEVFGPIKPR
jgi:lipoyl(octanoyl) transferase